MLDSYCPFCGAKDIKKYNASIDSWSVCCDKSMDALIEDTVRNNSYKNSNIEINQAYPYGDEYLLPLPFILPPGKWEISFRDEEYRLQYLKVEIRETVPMQWIFKEIKHMVVLEAKRIQ
jgi:hypothetical protein